jgi:integrase
MNVRYNGLQLRISPRNGLLAPEREAEIDRKAQAIVRDLTRYTKKSKQDRKKFPIRSVGTRHAVLSALRMLGRWLEANRLGSLSAVPRGAHQLYQFVRAESGVSASQLKKDRMAIAFAYGESLERVTAKPATKRPPREISLEQLNEVASHQSSRNASSSQVAYAGGLRPSELLTIARPEEQPPAVRQWNKYMHFGQTDLIAYTTIGKGGLARLFYLPKAKSDVLETYRRDEPTRVRERGRDLLSYYSIPGGDAWASSFRKACIRAYGESPGGHAPRHGYVARRKIELGRLGLSKADIELAISSELGHFREEIVPRYYSNGPWKPVRRN